jgi:hypothetical protein
MKYVPLCLLALAACPGDDANPEVLWLAPDMKETAIKLIGERPDPF